MCYLKKISNYGIKFDFYHKVISREILGVLSLWPKLYMAIYNVWDIFIFVQLQGKPNVRLYSDKGTLCK